MVISHKPLLLYVTVLNINYDKLYTVYLTQVLKRQYIICHSI